MAAKEDNSNLVVTDVVGDGQYFEPDLTEVGAGTQVQESSLFLKNLWTKYYNNVVALTMLQIQVFMFNMRAVYLQAEKRGMKGRPIRMYGFTLISGNALSSTDLNLKRMQALILWGIGTGSIKPSGLLEGGLPLYLCLPNEIKDKDPDLKYLLSNGCHLLMKYALDTEDSDAQKFRRKYGGAYKGKIYASCLLVDWIAYSNKRAKVGEPAGQRIMLSRYFANDRLEKNTCDNMMRNCNIKTFDDLDFVNEDYSYLASLMDIDAVVPARGAGNRVRFTDFQAKLSEKIKAAKALPGRRR